MRRKGFVRTALCFVLVVGCARIAAAAVRLPSVIGDNMVLQRGQPAPIWGWADKGEQVTWPLPVKRLPLRPATTGDGRQCWQNSTV